jgi:hypothetical protein
VRGGLGPALECARQDLLDLLDLLVAQPARRARARLIEQAVDAEVDKSLPPLARSRLRTALPAGDLLVGQAVAGQQHDPRPQSQGLRRLRATRPGPQLLTLLRAHRQWG